jgi:hypothetical protein
MISFRPSYRRDGLHKENLFQFTTAAPVEDDRFEGRAVLGGPVGIEQSVSAVLTSLRPARATAFEIETASENGLCYSGKYVQTLTGKLF